MFVSCLFCRSTVYLWAVIKPSLNFYSYSGINSQYMSSTLLIECLEYLWAVIKPFPNCKSCSGINSWFMPKYYPLEIYIFLGCQKFEISVSMLWFWTWLGKLKSRNCLMLHDLCQKYLKSLISSCLMFGSCHFPFRACLGTISTIWCPTICPPWHV